MHMHCRCIAGPYVSSDVRIKIEAIGSCKKWGKEERYEHQREHKERQRRDWEEERYEHQREHKERQRRDWEGGRPLFARLDSKDGVHSTA